MYEDTTNVTKNKIIFRENESLEVVKKGATNSTMKFHCDEYHESIYETPYGEMLLGVTTRTIESEVADSQITIKAYYELSVNCESYADCEISMKISNKNLGI